MPGVLAAVILSTVGLAVQAGWMPATAVDGVAREMAARLEQANVGIEPAKLLPSAQAGVESPRDRLDALGVRRVMSLSPQFPRLKLPAAGQPHLDAMAGYAMCTYYLEARFAKPPRGADVDMRLDAAMGPLSLAVTTMYLRHHYLAAGGSDERIKNYLDGDALNEVAAVVQKDPKLLDYTAAQCRAAVSTLLD